MMEWHYCWQFIVGAWFRALYFDDLLPTFVSFCAGEKSSRRE
jgi:hypothetical protein